MLAPDSTGGFILKLAAMGVKIVAEAAGEEDGCSVYLLLRPDRLENYDGKKPISVRWRLRNAIPYQLRGSLGFQLAREFFGARARLRSVPETDSWQ